MDLKRRIELYILKIIKLRLVIKMIPHIFLFIVFISCGPKSILDKFSSTPIEINITKTTGMDSSDTTPSNTPLQAASSDTTLANVPLQSTSSDVSKKSELLEKTHSQTQSSVDVKPTSSPLDIVPSMGIETNNTQLATNSDTMTEWDILKKTDPQQLAFLVKSVVIDKTNGAIGRNRPGFVSVGFQRYSTHFIVQGVLTQNLDLLDTALKSIEFPLPYQNEDGSFQDSTPGIKGTVSYPPSVAFYLKDAGHSLILLKNSLWFQTSNDTAALRSRVLKIQPILSKSLTWLIGQQSSLINGDGNGRATNRLWKDANAFYLNGSILNRSDAIEVGKKFAGMCLQQQNAAGAFLEMKGFDSSYQGVNLQEATVYYANLMDTPTQKKVVLDSILKGISLEQNSILPTGEVKTDGNTRVCSNPGCETYFDVVKTVDYLAIIQGFNYGYQLTQNMDIKKSMDLVFNFYKK